MSLDLPKEHVAPIKVKTAQNGFTRSFTATNHVPSRFACFDEYLRANRAKFLQKGSAAGVGYDKPLVGTACVSAKTCKHVDRLRDKVTALMQKKSHFAIQKTECQLVAQSSISEGASFPSGKIDIPPKVQNEEAKDRTLQDRGNSQALTKPQSGACKSPACERIMDTPAPNVWLKSFSKPATNSQHFINRITCAEQGKRCSEQKNQDISDHSYRHSSKSFDLPFSILTIREQRDYLKTSGDSFVQDAPCYEISKMYGVETSGPIFGLQSWCKCRECRSAKQKESLTVFCRFYGFRKLRFKDGLLCTAGFLLPEECTEDDLRLWLPIDRCFTEKPETDDELTSPSPPIDKTMADFILNLIGNQFCDIVLSEKNAVSWVEDTETIYWKRPVSGVREMCDVCETTLFNMHWVCPKCGYGVCFDCYERRMGKSEIEQEVYDGDKSNCFRWLRCAKGKNHFHSSLLPTQIIPSTCLWDLSNMVHKVRMLQTKKTPACPCPKNSQLSVALQQLRSMGQTEALWKTAETSSTTGKSITASTENRKRKLSDTENGQVRSEKCDERTAGKKPARPSLLTTPSAGSGKQSISLNDLIMQRIEHKKNNGTTPRLTADILHRETDGSKAESLPIDDQAHRNWLCDGRLLQLTDSLHPRNIDIFKLHWLNEVPVLVSGVGKHLNMDLWHPNQISREYGDENSKNSLVNCVTGSIVTNMKIRDFWDGFENISQRLLDEDNKTMILKLKDWPPTEAFHDVMPEMFEDLMHALPLPDYAYVGGKCNLASRLPHFFVKPDLGPKMYNAYGWVTEKDWRQGTTNLHLDISDAVNVMVYVGIPVDEPPEARDTLLQIAKEGEVDEVQLLRISSDKPGALWHIFHQRDADKIRHFIKKVCDERGETILPGHDPIHDQQIYLDKVLRRRLREEYDVEGYAILQCQGDGVFIPAGAPHQVFNLHSCIKIAEDFVSPEHVDKCFRLTNEFRYLSSTHSNHEDKLQIKNIIYHSVKDIVSSAVHVNCL